MSCFIVDAALSCALGEDLGECIRALKQEAAKVERRRITHVEEPIDIPYFGIRNTDAQPSHELMYRTTAKVVRELIDSVGLETSELRKTGLFWGSSSFTVSDSEFQYFSAIGIGDADALAMPIVGYNKLPEQLARQFGLSSCVHSYATACTSSANALLYADMFMERGDVDHAIVVGSEFFNSATVLGFHGLELFSASGKMLPFDERRDGLVLGEGCAAVFASKKRVAKHRFLGGASNTDSFSLTAANTDGSSIKELINKALLNAGKSVSDIDAIKVHGTASLLNDEAESAGLFSTFSIENMPVCYALKPYVGHTLGACGMVELALVVGAAEEGFVPSNIGVASTGIETGLVLNQVPKPSQQATVLLNYFAFGGNNTSLVVSVSK